VNLSNKLIAEFIGTFWLVLGGCGSAVLSAAFPHVGIGLLGVALAFGLTVLTMAYAIGHISGCHLNPAVSVGLVVGGRFPASELIPYIVAQVLGATAAAFLLYFIASGQADFTLTANGLAVNGYADLSPGKYSMLAGFVRTSCFVIGEQHVDCVLSPTTDDRRTTHPALRAKCSALSTQHSVLSTPCHPRMAGYFLTFYS
jgi:glycerol uptake facilitator-like aquaporin